MVGLGRFEALFDGARVGKNTCTFSTRQKGKVDIRKQNNDGSTHQSFSGFKDVLHHILKPVFLYKCLVLFIQLQSTPRVLYRIVFGRLNLLLEEEPR